MTHRRQRYYRRRPRGKFTRSRADRAFEWTLTLALAGVVALLVAWPFVLAAVAR
jgi:hypothetical protein